MPQNMDFPLAGHLGSPFGLCRSLDQLLPTEFHRPNHRDL